MAIFKLLPVLLAMVGVAYACSVAQGWKSQTIEERASEPDWVVYGTVISDHMPLGPEMAIEYDYTVIVQPLCWLKRGPEVSTQGEGRDRRDHVGEPGHEGNDTDVNVKFENITVFEFAPCGFNNLTKGAKYILFLAEGENGQFNIDDVNVQTGAFKEPSNDTIEAVHRGIDAGLKGYPHAECLARVNIPCFVGEADPKVCNKGNTLRAMLGFLILGVALAVIA